MTFRLGVKKSAPSFFLFLVGFAEQKKANPWRIQVLYIPMKMCIYTSRKLNFEEFYVLVVAFRYNYLNTYLIIPGRHPCLNSILIHLQKTRANDEILCNAKESQNIQGPLKHTTAIDTPQKLNSSP